MTRPLPHALSDYPYKLTIPTRWSDNDVYGHINNAVYYFYFDTAVNKWLIENQLLDIKHSQIIGLVVETGCTYFSPIEFPHDVTAGLRAAKIGNSSVQYEIGLFCSGDKLASAQGRFTHVYVDKKSNKPTTVSARMKEKLKTILRS